MEAIETRKNGKINKYSCTSVSAYKSTLQNWVRMRKVRGIQNVYELLDQHEEFEAIVVFRKD